MRIRLQFIASYINYYIIGSGEWTDSQFTNFVIIEPTVMCIVDFVLYNDSTFSTCVYHVLIYFTEDT